MVVHRHCLLLGRYSRVAASRHRFVFRRNSLDFRHNILRNSAFDDMSVVLVVAAVAAGFVGSGDCRKLAHGPRACVLPIQCHTWAVGLSDVFGERSISYDRS